MQYPIPFGKYLLLERISIGGMAEVFKAKTFGVEGFERFLAIKRILPNMAEDDEFVRMFVDEARIAVQLTHANIAQIYELGKHEGQFYIAMEYVASRDLRKVLDGFRKRNETVPLPMAAYIISRICEGLDHAHRKTDPSGAVLNIIHRDVSPQNILLSYDGEVKIIDFGIAKAAGRASKTQAGVLKGKFGYMSPEQVRGFPIDRRSDIFAVGILLYEMLTAQRLFLGESDFSTLEKVRAAEIPPPSQYIDLTKDLEAVILKSLAREPDERYKWGAELHEALQPFTIVNNTIFNAKRLSEFMRSTYSTDIEKERAKMEDFMAVKAPQSLDGRPAVPAAASLSPTENIGWNTGEHIANEKTMIFENSYDDDLANAATVIGISGEDIQSQLDALRAGLGTGGEGKTQTGTMQRQNGYDTQVDQENMAQLETEYNAQPYHAAPTGTVNSTPLLHANTTQERRMVQKSKTPASARPKRKHNNSLLYGVLGGATLLAIAAVALIATLLPHSQTSALTIKVPNANHDTNLTIYLDNKTIYTGAPQAALTNLTPGEHEILLKADGFKDKKITVTLVAGNTHFEVPMEAGVAGQTADNSKQQAKTSDANQDGAKTTQTKITENDSKKQQQSKKTTNQVKITSQPSGATVYLAGKQVGTTPMTLGELDINKSQHVILKLDGYKNSKNRIRFHRGKARSINASLKKVRTTTTSNKSSTSTSGQQGKKQSQTNTAQSKSTKTNSQTTKKNTTKKNTTKKNTTKKNTTKKNTTKKNTTKSKKLEFGTLIVSIKGAGPCKIFEKGKHIGDSPGRLTLSAGTHRLKIVAADGRTLKKTVKIKANKRVKLKDKFP